jgi:thioredoxin 1
MSYEPKWGDEPVTREELESRSGKVVVEFGAEWCPHCQTVQPLLQENLKNSPDVTHYKVADGKGKKLGRSFQVKLWPNFVFLEDGKVVEQLARPSGDHLKNALERW